MIICQLVKFAVTRKMVTTDPLAGLKLKKPKPTPQPTFDDEQIEEILRRARPPHAFTFLVLAETGMRFGDARWLTWADVDMKKNVLRIQPKDNWVPQSGDERVIPTTKRLVEELARRPRTSRWVLTAMQTKAHPEPDRQIDERRALTALKRILKPLGIEGKLHSCRHSFVSRCLTNGIEEAVVRSWVGHVDPAIMQIYTHIDGRISQDRIRQFDRRRGGDVLATDDAKITKKERATGSPLE